MVLRVYFKRNKETKHLNFGAALHSQQNDYIFGINTFIDKVNTEECARRGYFQVNFHKIPIKTNTYFFRLGIYGESEARNYDFVERSKIFKIVSIGKSHGMVEMGYSWK